MSDPEIDKILTKAFEDIKKRVNSHIVKREKKLLKPVKVVDTTKHDKIDKPANKKNRPRKESTSSESD